jgi:hypothetical protein
MFPHRTTRGAADSGAGPTVPREHGADGPCRPNAPLADTGGLALIPPEVQYEMPQALIVIFLLFFAVLAFAWFYVQRAKARDAAKAADASAGSVATTDAAPAAPVSEAHAEHVHTDDEHDHPH